MNAKRQMLFIGILLLILYACKREYSIEGSKQPFTDTLPADYPFATGYCNGVHLGISIADTNNYVPGNQNPLPASVMLDMPTPGNQGSQGSCTAWATVYGVGSYYMHLATGKPYSDTGNLSPKFTYNQITKGNCTCTSIIDNLYLLKTQGACTLNTMPYHPEECSIQPDSVQKNEAIHYTINDWRKVDLHNLNMIKRAVAEKKPVLFAIGIDEGFKTIAPPYIWNKRAGTPGEPHALVIAGYDNSIKALRVMNSWSTAWGDGGFLWIDYDFFLHN